MHSVCCRPDASEDFGQIPHVDARGAGWVIFCSADGDCGCVAVAMVVRKTTGNTALGYLTMAATGAVMRKVLHDMAVRPAVSCRHDSVNGAVKKTPSREVIGRFSACDRRECTPGYEHGALRGLG